MSGDYPQALIDLDALQHNLAVVRDYAPHSQVMAVIKADGYGHGVAAVAEALDGSDALAVARVQEALQLRRLGINKPLIVLDGATTAADLLIAAEYQLSLVFHHHTQLKWLTQQSLPQQLPAAWLMLETGMHRLGLRPELFQQAYETLVNSGAVATTPGLMSHFANSDLENDPRNTQQMQLMAEFKRRYQLPVCLANSGAVVQLPESHHEWVRPGIMLYGASPFKDKTAADLGLRPVMALRARLLATQTLQPGEQVGYGGDWQADKTTHMGVVSIGYGDGYNRHLSGCGEVVIRGQRAPVLGRVSMDTVCVDLKNCPEAQPGDEVLLWGNNLPVEQAAIKAGTIPYELLTQINPRVKRIYHHG